MVVQVHMDLRGFCIFYFRFVEKIVLLHLFFPMKDDFYFMEARSRNFFLYFSQKQNLCFMILEILEQVCAGQHE